MHELFTLDFGFSNISFSLYLIFNDFYLLKLEMALVGGKPNNNLQYQGLGSTELILLVRVKMLPGRSKRS